MRRKIAMQTSPLVSGETTTRHVTSDDGNYTETIKKNGELMTPTVHLLCACVRARVRVHTRVLNEMLKPDWLPHGDLMVLFVAESADGMVTETIVERSFTSEDGASFPSPGRYGGRITGFDDYFGGYFLLSQAC